jgi:hypothetical protein
MTNGLPATTAVSGKSNLLEAFHPLRDGFQPPLNSSKAASKGAAFLFAPKISWLDGGFGKTRKNQLHLLAV